ncbi:uncharacterized protein LOC134207586 [Armigeres subalbatus]|uniref:uncharacterized protein LOC134207586 n=1 Tax=Armigeres subalbatus TaxID=124917 RepID=UPI002ECFFEFF
MQTSSPTAYITGCLDSTAVQGHFHDFRKADFNSMNDFLQNLNWTEILHGTDANQAASSLSYVLVYAIDQFVSKIIRRKPMKPVWSNSHLKSLKRLKRAALKKHSKYRIDETRVAYLEAKQNYSWLNDRLYAAHQINIQDCLKSELKSFWNYVNDQRKQTDLPSTMTNGISEASTIMAIADLFRSQFSSVFSDEATPVHAINAAKINVPQLTNLGHSFTVTLDTVSGALERLKSSTGHGPDCIPSLLLKICSTALVLPLATVFNKSLTTGVFPNSWKQSYVFPMHKKGCKQSVAKYRGIAALNAVSKQFELIVLDELVHIYAHYVSPNQHGFVPKRSTTNLSSYTSFIIREMEKGQQVDAIYTDLSAAFDKMNHEITIAKFDKLGLNDRFK